MMWCCFSLGGAATAEVRRGDSYFGGSGGETVQRCTFSKHGCSAAFPRAVQRQCAPFNARSTFSKQIFLFDINVSRLRLATTESTDYDPENVADGQHSEVIGAAARQRRVRASGISKNIISKIRKDTVMMAATRLRLATSLVKEEGNRDRG